MPQTRKCQRLVESYIDNGYTIFVAQRPLSFIALARSFKAFVVTKCSNRPKMLLTLMFDG